MNDDSPLVWMPHPGHFICSHKCRFHLNTWVRASNVIVSTVGEYFADDHDEEPTPLGAFGLYETMAFTARESDVGCCQYVAADWGGIDDSERYDTATAALEGHHRWLRKYMEAT